MKATIGTTATLVIIFAGTLPAADPRLVNLVMPDATVIAGVNVAQAKVSPFGQYVLGLIAPHDQELQNLVTMTGFDPRQDVNELLVASNSGAGSKSGLVLGRGTFNVSAITNAATMGGATTEIYKSVTIVVGPKGTDGFAFLDSTLGVAGDVADIKGAIDRQSSSSPHLSQTVVSEINQLSGVNDAWALTTVPLSSLESPQGAPNVPGLDLQALKQIQKGTIAVKLGANVTVTAQAQLDTAQDATTLAGMLQLLVNLAQMQAKDPNAVTLAKATTISASGVTVTVTFSIPEAQLQQLLSQPHQRAPGTTGQYESKKKR